MSTLDLLAVINPDDTARRAAADAPDDAGTAWLRELEGYVNDPASPYYGRTEVLEEQRQKIADARARHGMASPSAEQVERMTEDHEKLLAQFDPEDRASVFYRRPQAAERARQEANERHELLLRRYGYEPAPPPTIEDKLIAAIDEEFHIDKQIAWFESSVYPDIVAQMRALNETGGFLWGDGLPMSDQDATEYRALLARGETPAGKYAGARAQETPKFLIDANVAALKAKFGEAQYAEMIRQAEYIARFDPEAELPKNFAANEYTLRNLASFGKYLRAYDDAREEAKIGRIAK